MRATLLSLRRQTLGGVLRRRNDGPLNGAAWTRAPLSGLRNLIVAGEKRLGWLITSRAGWWITAGTMAILLTLPLCLVEVPPLLDYPNHLARMYILAFAAHDPVLSHVYAARWSIIPDLGIDLVMPAMLRIMPIYVAGRVMLGVILLLQVAAVAIYSRVAFGRRSFWPLASGIMAYNAIFILGMMNYLLSLSLALLTAALWLAWRERYPLATGAATAVCAVAIFFCHIFGLLFLAVLTGGHELAKVVRSAKRGGPVIREALRRSVTLAIVFAAPALFYFGTRLHDSLGPPYWILWAKPFLLAASVWCYHFRVAALSATVVASLLFILFRRHVLRAAPGAGIALMALGAMFAIMPFRIGDATFIDVRIAVMVGLLLFAGFAPIQLPMRSRLAIGGVLSALFLVRIGSVAEVWYHHNRDLAQLRATIAPVKPGTRVLLVSTTSSGYWRHAPAGRYLPDYKQLDFHMAALLVIEKKAFWPLLFADPAQHPVTVLEGYKRLAGTGDPPDYRLLTAYEQTGKGAVTSPLPRFPYMVGWNNNFDYVLLLDADGAGDLRKLLPQYLKLLERTRFAALFQVRKPASRGLPVNKPGPHSYPLPRSAAPGAPVRPAAAR